MLQSECMTSNTQSSSATTKVIASRGSLYLSSLPWKAIRGIILMEKVVSVARRGLGAVEFEHLSRDDCFIISKALKSPGSDVALCSLCNLMRWSLGLRIWLVLDDFLLPPLSLALGMVCYIGLHVRHTFKDKRPHLTI